MSEVGATTAPYVGDQPGEFNPAFFGFLIFWLPAYALAGWLAWRFTRRREVSARQEG